MNVEELSAKLLLVLEGKRLVSYQDSKGIWTAGIGHTKGVTPGLIVTPEQVRQWFVDDQAPLLDAVSGRAPLEGAAYVSFGFNCGLAALKRVLSGQARMGDFIYSGKQPVLKPRRELEAALIEVSRSK